MANTKSQQRCIVGAKNYNQQKNKEFIQMALDLSNETTKQGKVTIQNIILNDTTIINNFSNVTGSQGKVVISSPGHDNHIHIEFDVPPRVALEVKNNKLKDDAIVSSAVKGSITKNNGKSPTADEKLKALGQI